MKPMRYCKTNRSLHIGGKHNKLSIFVAERSARLELGSHTWHFGHAWD
jgi:hypothetical protein